MLNMYVEEHIAHMRAAAREHEEERQRRLHKALSGRQASSAGRKSGHVERYSQIMLWLRRRIQAWGKRLDAAQAEKRL